MRNALTLLLCSALLSCMDGRVTTARPPDTNLPAFPFWTRESLPDGPRPDAPVPLPTASAVLVAERYLIAPLWGMGKVADDPLMDPTVFVFDGAQWHEGRYVDFDRRYELALIRADVPGTPFRLAGADADVARVAGLRAIPGAAVSLAFFPAGTCDPFSYPPYLADDIGTLCVSGPVSSLAGAALLDREGRLAGIQTKRLGFPVQTGPDAREIKEFFDLYFASWGRDVKPKPTL